MNDRRRLLVALIGLLAAALSSVAFGATVGTIRSTNIGVVCGLGDVDASTGEGYDDFAMSAYGSVFLMFGAPYGPTDWAFWNTNIKHFVIRYKSEAEPGGPDGRGDWFGVWLSGKGDVNNDGSNDLLIGDTRQLNNGSWLDNYGSCYVVYSVSEPSVIERKTVWVKAPEGGASITELQGSQIQSRFGCSCQILGERRNGTTISMDGDVFADILVGESGFSPGIEGSVTFRERYECGKASVFYVDESTDLAEVSRAEDADLTMIGESRNDHFGAAASSAGDLNGDGFLDIAIGAPWFDRFEQGEYTDNVGRVYVFLGSDQPLSGSIRATDASVIITGETSDGFFGTAISSGDFDGDGRGDLLIGAYGCGEQAGSAFVFLGKSLAPQHGARQFKDALDADIIIDGVAEKGLFGSSVSSAGDFFSGFGKSDAVLVGAPEAASASGAIYAFDLEGVVPPAELQSSDEGVYRATGPTVSTSRGSIPSRLGIAVCDVGNAIGGFNNQIAASGENRVELHARSLVGGAAIQCTLNRDRFHPLEELVASAETLNSGMDLYADVYVGFIMPDGQIICFTGAGFAYGVYPWLSGIFFASSSRYGPAELFRLNVPEGLPGGGYVYAGALSIPGGLSFISDVSVFPFTIETPR